MLGELLGSIEALFDNEQYVEAIERAQDALRTHARQLTASDYARIYRIVGLCARRLGNQEAAARALAEAYRRDPLDREVLGAWGQILFATGRADEGAKVFEALLLHHAATLTPNTRGVVLRTLAEHYLGNGNVRKARSKLDKALDADPGDVKAGLLLIRALTELGDESRLFAVREQFLNLVRDPPTQAALLHEHASALYRMGRVEEGLQHLRRAYELQPDDALFERIMSQLEGQGAWADMAAVIESRLPRLSGAALDESTERLLDIYTGQLHQPERAAEVLEARLDADPTNLVAFEKLTRLHGDTGDWRALHDAYARMIRRTHKAQATNAPLLAVLWKNVGELCRSELRDDESALYAFRMSFQHDPAPAVQELIIDLTARVGTPNDQIEYLARAIEEQPDRMDLAERYGAALMKAGRPDQGYLVLRTLVARGGGSEKAREGVARIAAQRRPTFHRALDERLRLKHLRPTGMSQPLDAVFDVAYVVLRELMANDLDTFDLRGRDRLDTSEPLLFSKLYLEACRFLGFEDPPDVFVARNVRGLTNAFFVAPTFLVGPDMLGGQNERELRFVLAQKLTMMRPRYQFAGCFLPEQLKLVVACLINAVRPDFEVGATPELNRMRTFLARRLDEAWRKPLGMAVDQMFADERLARVDGWLDHTAGESNRTGLLFCDDVTVALAQVDASPATPTLREQDSRKADLLRWAASESYAELRRELGVAIG